jgi:hypothetical protein
MKAKRLEEMRQWVQSSEAEAWWKGLVEARKARDQARERNEELLSQSTLADFQAELAQKKAIDTLYRAGELEDMAATLLAESGDLENSSLKLVADFEEQRFRASEAWCRVCGIERQIELLREKLELRKAKLASMEPGPARKEQQTEVDKLEVEARRVDRAHAQASRESERETARKNRLWAEAEHLWIRSFERSLLVPDQRIHGKKVRGRAERLFREAEERKQHALKLRAEADAVSREYQDREAKLAAMLKEASERFGCLMGEEFAFFRQKENPNRAWCLALTDDSQSYNIEVKSLALYDVDGRRGVEFLEPALEARPSASEAEDDRRFEEYFLIGRKGQVREEAKQKKSA